MGCLVGFRTDVGGGWPTRSQSTHRSQPGTDRPDSQTVWTDPGSSTSGSHSEPAASAVISEPQFIVTSEEGLHVVPTYWESIRVGWTILWRGVGSMMLLLMLINGLIITDLPELSRTTPSWGALLLPFGVTAFIGAFGIMPWLVKSLCTISYPGFRLQLMHEPASSAHT